MNAVRFDAVIDQDQTIRPPEGVILPVGEAEVIVVHKPFRRDERREPGEPLAVRLSRLAQELGVSDLPPDLSREHDHYAHGAPKGLDER